MRALLLQGPVGPLFADLHRGLKAHGWDVRRVCIDGGDLWTAGVDNPVHVWTGLEGDWATWIDEEMERHPPDVVVLFGAERPTHRVARDIADARGIPVLCMEEGYRRPGFMTAEWGGNNHRSRLRHLPLPTDEMPVPAPAPVPPGMRWIVAWTAITYTARVMYSLPRQWGMYHRQYVWPLEVGRWLRNLARRNAARRADDALLRRCAAAWAGSYDLVAMQVPGDSSLVMCGDGWTTERLIVESLRSLRDHAPADRKLVFKIHPLARGHADEGAFIRGTAAAMGLGDRVGVLTAGPLGPVLEHARGVVTISSTSAVSAIEKGKTTLVLGHGIAGRPELALCGPAATAIDAFWHSPAVATPRTVTAFQRLMARESLVPGDAYHPVGRAAAVAHTVAKIESALGAPQKVDATAAAPGHAYDATPARA